MPKETKLQEIHEWVAKAVPEIMELKFGCRFINLESTQTLFYLNETRSGAIFAFSETLGDDCYEDDFRFEDDTKIKILGRDIRLADMLVAIQKEKTKGLVSPDLKRLSEFWEVERIINTWDLTHDSLDAQSEELLDFLLSLKN